MTIGIVFGGLFGLAVASFADGAGPDCMYQRTVGVLGHAAGAGVAGATASLIAGCVRSVRRHRERAVRRVGPPAVARGGADNELNGAVSTVD